MLALSQVILGVQDLDRAAARLRGMGLEVQDGGVHPGLGTANRVVPLDGQYLELLEVVDRALAETNEYGRAVLRGTASGDRLLRWSLRTDDIEGVAARLGLRVERRQRVRPDGVRLTWRAAGLLSLQHPGGVLELVTRVQSPDGRPHDEKSDELVPDGHEQVLTGRGLVLLGREQVVLAREQFLLAGLELQPRCHQEVWSCGEIVLSGRQVLLEREQLLLGRGLELLRPEQFLLGRGHELLRPEEFLLGRGLKLLKPEEFLHAREQELLRPQEFLFDRGQELQRTEELLLGPG